MTRACILAAGEQTRWGLPLPKQLVPIGDELLILRTVRQLGGLGIPATIVAHDRRILQAVNGQAPVLDAGPFPHRWTVETALSCLQGCAGRQIVLLGDVVFTDEAMRAIATCEDACRVFLRGSLTGRVTGFYREIFGFSFDDRGKERVIAALEKARDNALGHWGAGKLREFYCDLCGAPYSADGNYPLDNQYIHWPVNDYTDDIDAPEDYEAFIAAIVQPGLIDTRH